MNLNDHHLYVSLTMEFRCNLRCTHCMIEGTMDRLRPTSEQTFENILQLQLRERKWKGLILTGSEITLHKDLPRFASQARNAGFERVRIQTHGMHLGRLGYAKKLLDSGVNEFFISVAGGSEALHDEITKVPGSFRRMIKGIEIIEAEGGDSRIITNTVITAQSYQSLRNVVHLLEPYSKVIQNEFWNYFPMAEEDTKSLLVPYRHLMPYLIDAIRACVELGRGVEVKNVPHCLLEGWKAALVNAQPALYIDKTFWTEFDRNYFYQCPHRSLCASETCLGLTEAYISRFGEEAHLLKPLKRSDLA